MQIFFLWTWSLSLLSLSGEGRKAAATAVADGTDELFNKGDRLSFFQAVIYHLPTVYVIHQLASFIHQHVSPLPLPVGRQE